MTTESNLPIGKPTGKVLDTTQVTQTDGTVAEREAVVITDPENLGNRARVTDQQALQVTFPPEGKTAFGELAVAEPTLVAEMQFPYGINPVITESRENQSGSVSHTNRQAVLATGAAANSSAEARSSSIIRYQPGAGVMARFTGFFTTGVAGNVQKLGIGNADGGLYFGYNGTSFGIFYERYGLAEVRTLTITTASSHAENVTITLDGDAVAVAVTASGVITTTANEIAAGDYSDVGRGWTAYAAGNKVEFVSWDAATHTDTYSLSGTSAVGTFAQNVAGAALSSTFTAQASWNGDDIFDGNGVTGVTLNPTKGNVYQIRMQWLGYGALQLFVEDPDDGELHLVHTIEYANANTRPAFNDPAFRLRGLCENTSGTSNVSLTINCMAGYIEGRRAFPGVRFGAVGTNASVSTTTLPLLSIRMGTHFNGYEVQTLAKILRIFMAVEHTKPMQILVYTNPTLTGASWADAVSGVTATEIDTSASAMSGGTLLAVIALGRTGNTEIDFSTDEAAAILQPGQVFTLGAKANSGTGEATVSVNILEQV